MLRTLAATARVGVLALGLGLVPRPGAVRAAPFEVAPIELELTRAAKNATLTIHNGDTEPMRLQVTAVAWQQARTGEMQLTPTRDVAFYPGLLTIAPGQKRNIRIAAAAPFGDVEKTYRVLVEQLPGAAAQGQNRIRVRTRVGIPVYLEPQNPSPRAELGPIGREGARASFALRSTGNVRINPQSVRLLAHDEGGALVFERSLPAWYVLAGGERAYEAEIPARACARVRSLVAEVIVGKETLRARLPTAGGACAP